MVVDIAVVVVVGYDVVVYVVVIVRVSSIAIFAGYVCVVAVGVRGVAFVVDIVE